MIMNAVITSKVKFTDDEQRMGYVLSVIERKRPTGEGFVYTSNYKYGRIEVLVYKVEAYDPERAQRRLDVYGVIENAEGLKKVNPQHADVWIKDRPVHRRVIHV